MKKKVLLALGKSVKIQRTLLGISQEELGLRSGLDRTYISGIERGVRNPSFTALVALSQGLGLTVSELFFDLEKEIFNINEHK
ncbi:MAG: helix-turn-helix transcriptional regulator [Cyanobacteria bacterium]|nr:helix-turn-helix transcriptional regulator [Cyanobacteria bacterium CG_2015-16_32_12]NCO79632.1 helix-turn-helix transcriptional regulator [Cyanobacteria bacterium CG_2015-22_32_23]NCQ04319.1 helix-turn-helix transcriptional regulator [Cyanobacteria bacterium CG_2015-09_32_10]